MCCAFQYSIRNDQRRRNVFKIGGADFVKLLTGGGGGGVQSLTTGGGGGGGGGGSRLRLGGGVGSYKSCPACNGLRCTAVLGDVA